MTVVTLYGKPGCHLCEEAKRAILSVRLDRELELREVDVSLDPGLHRSYGERIPVVEVAGKELFEYHVDVAVLKEHLARVRS